MKKITFPIIMLFFLLSVSQLFAQTFPGFKYQAVVRNQKGDIIVSQEVNFRITLLAGSTTGTPLYRETHTVTSSPFGLVNLEVGKGTLMFGDFKSIAWDKETVFMKIEMDATGGTNYSLMGVSQLLPVPFAYYAVYASKTLFDGDTSSTNELQQLVLNGQQLSITKGNTIMLPPIDTSSTNELQQLNLKNDTLFLSNGNFVYLGPYNNTADLNILYAKVAADSTLFSGLISTNALNFNTAINNEITIRTKADSAILSKVVSDSSTLQGFISGNLMAINTEVAIRKTADSLLDIDIKKALTKIATDSTYLSALIDTANININTLNTNLLTEIFDRLTVDTLLYNKIIADSSYLKTLIDNEIITRYNTDSIINNLIFADSTIFKGLIDNISAALNTEIADRDFADSLIIDKIIADSNYFKGLIDNNSTSLNTEIADRDFADSLIIDKIIADSTYLYGLIDNNTTAINNEQASRTNADNSLQTAINNQTIKELADSAYLKGLIGANTTDLTTEITNRINADNAIYTKTSNDSAMLESMVYAESLVRESYDNNLHTKIVADSSYLKGLINTNTADISGLSLNYYTKTNMQTSGSALLHFDNLTNKPTTLAGYGITDAAPLNHSHADATTTTSGFISAVDKTKLNNITGTNTGDQTITLTGDVAGSGTGSFATTIANNAITSGKIANNSINGTKLALGGDVLGDMMYYNGTDWVRLPLGTAGQVLTVNSGLPGWQSRHYIGESFGGGIVYFVDPSGQHGLIAAASDASTGVDWSNVTGSLAGVYSKDDGVSNSADIVAQGGHTSSAAKVCLDYTVIDGVVTYDDWYLPATYQLNLLFNQAYAVGSLANANYWSSTEFSATDAWRQNFISGQITNGTKTGNLHRVRCIREF